MATIKTKQQIYDEIVLDLENKLGITLSAFGRVLLRILALVYAGALKLVYLSIGFVQKNIAPDLADPEEKGGTLDRFGLLKLGRKRFPATQAQYTATVTGTTAAVIPAGTTFKSDSNALNAGYLFILDNAYTMPSGTGTITIRALTAGSESRLVVGNTLTATSPIADINRTITVATETVMPQAAETIEEYRAKIIQAYRIEPQGGSKGDYRLWGYDAQGTREIYPYASSGNNNEVDIYVEATIADSTDGRGTPTSTILSDVEDVIEASPDTTLTLAERSRRPLGVFLVNVYPIVLKEIDINIASFADLTSAKQATILAAITEALYNVRPFIAGIDIVAERNDIFDTNRIGAIVLAAVPGSSFGTITLSVDSVPMASYQFDNGEIPYLDAITYV
jgi:uncharacterized phage protein gp47/JayE